MNVQSFFNLHDFFISSESKQERKKQRNFKKKKLHLSYKTYTVEAA